MDGRERDKEYMRIRLCYRQWMQFILLFAIEFDLPRLGILSMRKIALVLLLFFFIKQHGQRVGISKKSLCTTAQIGCLFIYVIGLLSVRFDCILQMPNGSFRFIHLVTLFLMLIIYPTLLRGVFRNVTEFIQCQWKICLFQAVVVLLGRLFLPIRLFVFKYTAYGDGRLLDGVRQGLRSVGIDLVGAAGSMVLFAGIMCGVYLFYQSKDRHEKKHIVFGWMCIMAALLFVGRTGLYFGGIVILGVVFYGIFKHDKSVRWLFLGMVAIVSGCLFYDVLSPNSSWMRWIMEIGNLFGDNKTIDVLLNKMNIPPLTYETFFGTGMVSGKTTSGLVLNHDAGYVRAYSSIGVLGSILFYGLIYCFYFSLIRKVKSAQNKWIYSVFLLVLVIAEMKEPFLWKTPLMLILSTMLILETDFYRRKAIPATMQKDANNTQGRATIMS